MGFRALTQLRRHYAGQAGRLITDFYVPVLSGAVRYDRQAGYFDSVSLVQLAAGLAAFIGHVRALPADERPPMRLITGATRSPDDIEAYQRGQAALSDALEHTLLRRFEPSDGECERLGLPRGWRPEADLIAGNRLGALAWMVGAGLLEVRIAMPLPKAVADCLAAFVPPDGPPEHDPLELVTAPIALRDRVETQWLLDAPRRPGG